MSADDDHGDEAHRLARPLGVSLLIWMFWFWAGALVLLVGALVAGTGPVMLAGEAVPRGEALGALLPAVAPMALAVMGAAVALMLALPWGRAAALFPFVLVAFGPLLAGRGTFDVTLTALFLVPLVATLGWYLYFRPGPHQYFRRRLPEEADRAGSGAAPPPAGRMR